MNHSCLSCGSELPERRYVDKIPFCNALCQRDYRVAHTDVPVPLPNLPKEKPLPKPKLPTMVPQQCVEHVMVPVITPVIKNKEPRIYNKAPACFPPIGAMPSIPATAPFAGHVYLMYSPMLNLHKIGKTERSVSRRLIHVRLAVRDPEAVIVFYLRSCRLIHAESFFHRHFRHKRVIVQSPIDPRMYHYEWFDLNVDDIAWIGARGKRYYISGKQEVVSPY